MITLLKIGLFIEEAQPPPSKWFHDSIIPFWASMDGFRDGD